MAALSSSFPQYSCSRNHGNSRKHKSLGLLCSNFLSLYDREDVQLIDLDDTASRLGAERRRIYDIANILEGVGVLERKAKNQYYWKGFEAIPAALQQLKEEGLKENFGEFNGNDHVKLLGKEDEVGDDDDEDGDEDEDEVALSNPALGSKNSNSSPTKFSFSKSDNRREKSSTLVPQNSLVAQNFVKLFMCSEQAETISLYEARKLLFGDDHEDSLKTKTEISRLYDIANVLSSTNLTEKIHGAVTSKPAFGCSGWRKEARNEVTCSKPVPESRKRAFEIDVANINIKKKKIATSAEDLLKENYDTTRSANEKDFTCEVDRHGLGDECTKRSKLYDFGPFAPAIVAKVGPDSCKENENHDWASLASTYRPQYQNQALMELFYH